MRPVPAAAFALLNLLETNLPILLSTKPDAVGFKVGFLVCQVVL